MSSARSCRRSWTMRDHACAAPVVITTGCTGSRAIIRVEDQGPACRPSAGSGSSGGASRPPGQTSAVWACSSRGRWPGPAAATCGPSRVRGGAVFVVALAGAVSRSAGTARTEPQDLGDDLVERLADGPALGTAGVHCERPASTCTVPSRRFVLTMTSQCPFSCVPASAVAPTKVTTSVGSHASRRSMRSPRTGGSTCTRTLQQVAAIRDRTPRVHQAVLITTDELARTPGKSSIVEDERPVSQGQAEHAAGVREEPG